MKLSRSILSPVLVATVITASPLSSHQERDTVTCSTQLGTDHYGGDYSYFSTSSFDTCAQACQGDSRCVTAQFAKNTNTCYLKSSLTAASSNSDVDTVICRSGAAAPLPTCTTIRSVDYYGGDYASISASTFQDCVSACQQDSSCVTAQFRVAYQRCYLKSYLTQQTSDQNVDTVICRGPSPPGTTTMSTTSTTTTTPTTTTTTTTRSTTTTTPVMTTTTTTSTTPTTTTTTPHVTTTTTATTTTTTAATTTSAAPAPAFTLRQTNSNTCYPITLQGQFYNIPAASYASALQYCKNKCIVMDNSGFYPQTQQCRQVYVSYNNADRSGNTGFDCQWGGTVNGPGDGEWTASDFQCGLPSPPYRKYGDWYQVVGLA